MENSQMDLPPSKKYPKQIISIVIVAILLVLGYYFYSLKNNTIPMNTQNEEASQRVATSVSSEHRLIALKEFYPGITGEIADSKVAVPNNYILFTVPSHLNAYGDYIWGIPEEIEKAAANPYDIDIKALSSGFFQSNLQAYPLLDASGNLADDDGPITWKNYKEAGVKQEEVLQGFLGGSKDTPVLSISQKEGIHMIMLYSSSDKKVLRIKMTVGTDSDITEKNWNSLVESLDIR